MRRTLSMAVFSLILFPLAAQSKKAFPDSAVFRHYVNVPTAEEAMYTFRTSHDLSQYGGWKWYGRFLAEYGQRANPDGSLPDAATYYQLLKSARDYGVKNRAGNGWFPLGPDQKPITWNGLGSHGVGRINCIAFDPSNEAVWYVGFGQAGIWKTTDTGHSWTELNNGLPILRISDIAIDPNNTKVLYACLGDFAYCEISLNSADRKRYSHYGMGVFKSTDGGLSWKPTGLSASQTDFDGSLFRRVFVNPANSSELVAAGISGIYKSSDAGQNWNKVYSGTVGDLEMDPMRPDVLYAAGRYLEFSAQGKANMLKSYDFGNTWKVLTTPWKDSGSVTRVEMAMAPSDTNYIYAVCVGSDGGKFLGFYQSTDAGKTWKSKYNHGYNLMTYKPWDSFSDPYVQGKYDLALCVNPGDKNKVYLGGVHALFSSNGGADFSYVYHPIQHPDQHQYKIHPTLNKWVLCSDGGLYLMDPDPVQNSFDYMITMNDWNDGDTTHCEFRASGMNVGSFYRSAVALYDTASIIAGAQDNGSSLHNYDWFYVSGGDGMDCSVASDEFITSSQYGYFYYFFSGSYDNSWSQSNPYKGKGEWTTPLVTTLWNDDINKQNSFSNIYLLYSDLVDANAGFSPLSSFTNTRPGTALAISDPGKGKAYLAKKPLNSSKISGEIWMSNMATNTWKNISAGLPDSIYVTDIEIDGYNDSIAYVSFSGFVDGQKVYMTKNAGKTWTNISKNLPNLPANTLAADSADPNHGVYVGTDAGVYYFNDTLKQWKSFSDNLPHVIVSDLDIQPRNHMLLAATFGRSMWAYNLPPMQRGNPQSNNKSKNIAAEEIKILSLNDHAFEITVPVSARVLGYDMLDQCGKRVTNGKLQSGSNHVQTNLSAGIYYLRIYSANEMLRVEKVMILH